MNETVSINYKMNKSNFTCCIFLDDVSLFIIRCFTGNCTVCIKYKETLKRNCLICRTSKLIHNRFLEKHLESYEIECTNQNNSKTKTICLHSKSQPHAATIYE